MKRTFIEIIVFTTLLIFIINGAYCQPGIIFNKILSGITDSNTKNILTNLTSEQKNQIELSVYKNVVLPIVKQENKEAYLGISSDHWIDENYDGEIIKLEDGSMWEVMDIDVVNAMLWLPIDNIKIKKSKDPFGEYIYKMKNEDDEDPVLVKLLKQ